MSNAATNPYLKTKILTASSEELRLMLFDGAIKFCKQGRAALAEKQYEESYNNLMRAQKIVLELSTSLNHEVDPDLCSKLAGLYTYIYRLLVDANMQRETQPIDEAVELLTFERETWQMLIEKVRQQNGPEGAEPRDDVGAQQTAISSLSLNG